MEMLGLMAHGLLILQFNEEGKLAHYMEWYDSADLAKEFD